MPKWSTYIPYPPKVTTDDKIPGISPKQTAFLLLNEQEALFGGSVGGGKSEALLIGALQYVDDYPTSSLLLRRTYRDLDKPGGLMFRARQWLTPTKAHWDGINYRWVFPNGATLNFGYLEHAGDELKFQSSEYQYCVQADTLIRMGDCTWKPIKEIEIGDFVDTLIGSKRVNKVLNVGIKDVVKVETEHGSIIASTTHPMLTDSGWVSPEALKPTRCRDGHTRAASSMATYSTSWMRPLYRLLDRLRPYALSQLRRLGIDLSVRHVSSTDGQIGSSTSCDVCRESSQPQEWFGSLMLHGPAVQSTESESFHPHRYVNADATTEYATQGSQPDYQSCCDSCGERSHPTPIASRAHIPSLVGAEGSVEISCSDAADRTPTHIPLMKYRYFHPYTNRLIEARVAVQCSPVRISPAGEAEVWDLEVADASHYVTWGGIIARNCGYDELTHFSLHQYLYLFSRLRRLKDTPVPLRLRSGTNPGGPGHEWVRKRWNLPDGPQPGSNRVFVQAGLYDNPFLEHEEYVKGLNQLGDVTKAQLLSGDWTATSTGGYFVAEKFRRIGWDEVPDAKEFIAIIRYWDFAATEPSEMNPDPDYTVGLKLGMTRTGSSDPSQCDWYVLDVERFRSNPGAIESRVHATAKRDGPRVVQWLEQERGAAGKLNFNNYATNVLAESIARPLYATGTKTAKAAVAAARVSEGRVFLVDGPWVDDFVAECAVFPMGSHDDQVDGLSNGIVAIDKERHFASQGTVVKIGAKMRPVRRGKKRPASRHIGY